ncbi:MAG: hypothetical protein AB7V32_10875 [Candidatus Berkiella sp.]
MQRPRSSENLAFPWWYNWVKWVLPVALALTASAWVGLTLTATIPAYGMLKWAPVFFSSLEGFSALAALTFAMGAIASMVGIGTTFLTRALLSNVSENLAHRAIERTEALTEKYQDVVNQLKELNELRKQEREEADVALEAAGQRHDLLRQSVAPQANPDAGEEPSNDAVHTKAVTRRRRR